MAYYLGIVGLSNTSEAALSSVDGSKVVLTNAPPLSLRDDSDLKGVLTDTFRELSKESGLRGESFLGDLKGACFAMTGTYADRHRKYFKHLLTQIGIHENVPTVVCENCNAHLAAAQLDAGCVIRAGTGSVVYVRTKPDGQVSRIDGWGNEIGDAGSGYALGIQALRSIFKHADARTREADILRGRIFECLALPSKSPDESDLAQWFHDLRTLSSRRARIASLMIPLCKAAELDSDPLAISIVDEGATALVRSFQMAMDRVLIKSECYEPLGFPIVLHGSVFWNSTVYNERFRDAVFELSRRGTRAYIHTSSYRSAVGALALAMSNSDFIDLTLSSVKVLGRTASLDPKLAEIRGHKVGGENGVSRHIN